MALPVRVGRETLRRAGPWPRRLGALLALTGGLTCLLAGGGLLLARTMGTLVQPGLREMLWLGGLTGVGTSALLVAWWCLEDRPKGGQNA